MPISISTTLRTAYLRAVIASQNDMEKAIERNRLFYDGEQGIKLTPRQREYIGDIANDLDKQAFANLCRRTVEIPLERLRIDQVLPNEDDSIEYSKVVAEWWKDGGLDKVQSELYEDALRDKCGVIIVAYDREKGQPTFTVNELFDGKNGQIRLHYSEDTDQLMYASKRWRSWDNQSQTATGPTRLTVYFDDRIERYEDDSKAPDGWRLLDPLEVDPTGLTPNPQPWTDTGEVDGIPLGNPVIPFWNPGNSELDDVLMPQKALNKSIADFISTSDMHGFPILTATGIVWPTDSSGKITPPEVGPASILFTPNEEGKFGRIEPSDLKSTFDVSIMGWIQIVSIIKGWPMQLFTKGAPPSGEALKTMEASLIAQVERKQSVFGDAWRDAFGLGARLDQMHNEGADFSEKRLKFDWHPAAPRDRKTQAEAQSIEWTSQEIPIEQRWIEAGYTPEEIEVMKAMKDNEQKRALETAIDAMRERELISPDDDSDEEGNEE